MGWEGWPPAAGDNIQPWEFLIQAWWSVQEINAILSGSYVFPPPDATYGGGTVVSVTAGDGNELVVDCGTVDWRVADSCSGTRWVNYLCTNCNLSILPQFYELLIDTDDIRNPWRVVRGAVVSQDWTNTGDGTGPGTLTIDGAKVLDSITAGFNGGLSDLAGRKFYMIRPGANWISDRLPDKPNEPELWHGTDSTGGVTEADGDDPAYSYITDVTAAWSSDEWADKELLVWADDGLLHRVTITGNTSGTIYFDAQDWTAGGMYSVVDVGRIVLPGRRRWRPFQWYYGVDFRYYTHGPDDTLTTSPFPTNQYGWDEGDPCNPFGGDCQFVGRQAFDADLFIEFNNVCESNRAGTWVARDFWKSLRQIQNVAVGLSAHFIPPNADWPASFTPATLFDYCGINSGTSSLEYDSTANVWSFEADSQYNGWPVYWTVQRNHANYAIGQTVVVDGVVSGIGSFTTHHGDDLDPDSDVGLSVTYSAGWSRYVPLWFKYDYPKTIWIPDTLTAIDGSVTAIDPPAIRHNQDSEGNELTTWDCNGTGVWQHRPASTTPIIASADGYQVPDPKGWQVGKLYRSIGDNYHEPALTPHLTPETSYNRAIAPYVDHWYRGKLSPANQSARDASRNGTVSSGTARSLTDSAKHWWSDYQNGNFTSPSAASLTSIIPYTPADPDAVPPVAEVPGSGTATIDTPTLPVSSTWTVTDDLDGSGTGTVVLSGSYAFPEGATQPTTVAGRFTEAMIGYTITFTFSGNLRTESGTATAGSSITLVNATIDTTDVDQPFGCWWANYHFQGGQPFAGFILEITKPADGDEPAVTWKVPVTGSTTGQDGITLTFEAVAGLTVSSGYTYLIAEPRYERDKWQGRELRISDDQGNHYTTTVNQSDDDTLYFDPIDGVDTVDTGWTYSIVEKGWGQVWKCVGVNDDGTPQMEQPTGADMVRMGVTDPEDFLTDQTKNLESYQKIYGPLTVGDAIKIPLFRELYDVLNAMDTQAMGADWINKACDDADPEDNFSGGVSNCPPYGFCPADQWELAVSSAQANYAVQPDETSPTGAPYAITSDAYDPSFSSRHLLYLSGRFNYLYVTGIPTVLPSMVTFKVFSPKWPDQSMTYSIENPPGSGEYDFYTLTIPGEQCWTGAEAGLTYNGWSDVSSGCQKPGLAYSASIGSGPPTAVNEDDFGPPAGATGGSFGPGGIATGWSVTDKFTIVKWTREFTGGTMAVARPRPARPASPVPQVVKVPGAVPATWRPGQGAKLWADLHGYVPTGDPTADRAWLNGFTKRVPCGSCRQHWAKLVEDMPAVFDSLDQYRRWTVDVHNLVNVRLGREAVTFAQAAETWGW